MSFPKSCTAALVLALLVGCAPGPAARPASQEASGATGGVAKTIILGQLNAVQSYGPWDFSNTSGGGAALAEIHTNGLISEDVHHMENVEPQLAARLPSLDDGTISVSSDGRTRITWTLRPNIKWHDGTAFSADDLVFTWQVLTHPDLRSSIDEVIRRAERVEATGPLTLVFTWSSPFYRALDLSARDFWPLPRHILAEAFEGDKLAFLNQRYFTTEYVNLGPFRLVDFGLGENQVFERFDDYYLGRPKVNTIILRTISDTNTMLANLRAGAVDAAGYKTLPAEMFVRLKEEWGQSGAMLLAERQDNWRYAWFQFDPQWGQPPEMSRDARIRRGLMYGLDRDALRDLLVPGFAHSSADSFMLTTDTRWQQVGQPFARYRYDPTRAAQEMADGGWRRGGDGRLLNAVGQQVQIEVRGNPPDAPEIAAIADFWRRLGVDVTELLPPPALGRDNEYKSKFPGLETRARGTGGEILVSFDSRLHSTAQNRWQGANTGHYANPLLDRMIDQLYVTVDESAQVPLLREIGELMATDLPALPLYFKATFATVNKSARILTDYGGPALMPRYAHQWDRD